MNDFRKIAGFEAYAPTDNVSELTARTNDEGWASVFVEWLRGSRLRKDDCLFIFSVGGGNDEKNSRPTSSTRSSSGAGRRQHRRVVGRDGGYTKQVADACVLVPTVKRVEHHAARRGIPGRDLAPARLAPEAQEGADEVESTPA